MLWQANKAAPPNTLAPADDADEAALRLTSLMFVTMSEILFLGGPSGTGKSSFASKYLTSLGWRHLEIDLHPNDGITEHHLRDEWDRFLQRLEPLPLRDTLLERAGGSPGIVLSYPGNLIFSARQSEAAAGVFRIAYLYGHPAHCLRAFLARERETRRKLPASHWDQNNRAVFAGLSCSPQHRFLVDAFSQDGSRRDPKLIYGDIFLSSPSAGPYKGRLAEDRL